MSYEGWEQILCKNGHYHSADCHDYLEYDESVPYLDLEKVWKCPTCGERAVWWNAVDVTNGSYCSSPECKGKDGGCEWCDNGRIDGYVELEEATQVETSVCDKCGLTRTINQPTYKIQQQCGHRVNIK